MLEKPPESPFLRKSLDFIANKEWRERELQFVVDRMVELALMLDYIGWLRSDSTFRAEVALDVVRYGGRGSPFFLYLQEGDFLPDEYDDCPPASDYRMGSYFTGENLDETERFILDRAGWAEKLIQREIEVVVDYYHALEEWDLVSELPPPTSDEFIFQATLPPT